MINTYRFKILSILLLVTITCFISTSCNVSKTNTNGSNSRMELAYKGWNYYLDSNENINRSNNTENIKLNDAKAYEFFIYKDKIYYRLDTLDETGGLEVMDLDGSNSKRIVSGYINPSCCIDNGIFYYIAKSSSSYNNPNAVYGLSLDSYKIDCLFTDSNNIINTMLDVAVSNKQIFVGSTQSIYSIINGNCNKLEDANLFFTCKHLLFGLDTSSSKWFMENLDGSGEKYLSDNEYKQYQNERREELKNQGILTTGLY